MKYNIISYLIGDGIKNITKNKKSTFSAIAIMIVTMLTVGICFIIGENVNAILDKLKEDYSIEVFIEKKASELDTQKLESEIRSIDNVNTITYVTEEQAFYRAQEKLVDDTDILVNFTPEEHPFPPSFIVTIKDLDKIGDVISQIETFDNVFEISKAEEQEKADNLKNFSKYVNIVLITAGLVLVVFSMIIIGNTIKLTVHARRKEISIMKYVGATNNFVRAPFIVEGIIIGIISSAISVLTVSGVYVWIKNYLIDTKLEKWLQGTDINSGVKLLELNQMFTQLILIFLLLGIGIGVLGSIHSMKKYLKV